jgi:hypothetical protein
LSISLGFQSQVEKSQSGAKEALKTVPEIQKDIQEADNLIMDAEEVSFLIEI